MICDYFRNRSVFQHLSQWFWHSVWEFDFNSLLTRFDIVFQNSISIICSLIWLKSFLVSVSINIIIMKFVLFKYDVINKTRNIKQNNESIREYYERINDSFIVEFDYRNKTKNVTLFEEKLVWLTFVIEKWIKEIKSTRLFDYFANKFVKNLFDAYIIAKRKMLKKKRKFRQKKKRKFQKKYQIILQQFQNYVDHDVFYEFSLILKKLSCDLSKISTDDVNSNDIETINEIFVFEFDKWIVVATKKKFFDYINTFANFSKNSLTFDIESISNNSFDWNRCCTVNMKTLNQKIFVLIVIFDAFLKNSFALFFENLKISIAMNISSLKHFMNMNDFAIKTFDSDIAMNTSLKNSSLQHIENSKTLKKNSIHIFYELFSLSAFDLCIDIDFQIYTIDIETFSFDWNRSCNNFIDSRIFSIAICVFVSNVVTICENIDFYEKKQLFCSTRYFFVSTITECITVSNTNFHEKKQFFCFNVDVVVVVENIDAFILIVDLINITMNFVWISFLNFIENVISKSKHKKLSKMKIKRC